MTDLRYGCIQELLVTWRGSCLSESLRVVPWWLLAAQLADSPGHFPQSSIRNGPHSHSGSKPCAQAPKPSLVWLTSRWGPVAPAPALLTWETQFPSWGEGSRRRCWGKQRMFFRVPPPPQRFQALARRVRTLTICPHTSPPASCLAMAACSVLLPL